MISKKLTTSLWKISWPFLAFVAMMLLYYSVGTVYLQGFLLDLGSINLPTPRYVYFLLFWTLFGSLATVFLSVGGLRLLGHSNVMAIVRQSNEKNSDRQFMLLGVFLGILIPLLIRLFVLKGAPLTDDESAYRFMAELIASGRLYTSSPSMKLFFDNIFMINGGHFYAQYFLGWPLLMLPGVLASATGYLNALYSGLTVLSLYLILRKLSGSYYARLGVLLYISSPMMMIASATELSQTSCMLVLSWMIWFFLRLHDEDSPWWANSGFSLALGLAFFIRPATATAVALPFLVALALHILKGTSEKRRRAIFALAIPALMLAAIFLLVNKLQNGAFLRSAYQRYFEYLRENDFRFSVWTPDSDMRLFAFRGLGRSFANLALGFFRLNFDLFGWPIFFILFLPFAWLQKWGSAVILAFFTLLGTTFFALDAGIDTFGPVHLYEAGLLAIIFIVLGVKGMSQRLSTLISKQYPSSSLYKVSYLKFIPHVMLIALILASLIGYAPFRLNAVSKIAESINTPFRALAESGIQKAVIFAPAPFIPTDHIIPTRHFVFFRPNNDPDLQNDVLWVNHISVQRDKELMTLFPKRKGYIMVWTKQYRVKFLFLDSLGPTAVPDAVIGGSGKKY